MCMHIYIVVYKILYSALYIAGATSDKKAWYNMNKTEYFVIILAE